MTRFGYFFSSSFIGKSCGLQIAQKEEKLPRPYRRCGMQSISHRVVEISESSLDHYRLCAYVVATLLLAYLRG